MDGISTAIMADDLTSALDGAAGFAARGAHVSVALREAPGSNASEVISIDLDSRFDDPERAFAKAERAGQRIAGARVLYKTVDSTLRGNLAAETGGILCGSGRERAIIAPAFPDAGRITRAGRQWVNGVPVSKSAFAKDIRSPVLCDRIAQLFSGLHAEMTVCDAETNGDLDAIVARHAHDPSVLWVGSPGLGAALSRHFQPVRPVAEFHGSARRVLVVVGSLHAVNASQIEALTLAGAPLVLAGADLADAPARLAQALATSAIAILATSRTIEPASAPQEVAAGIAQLVASARRHFDGLVVSGGDTARRIVDRLGGTAIRLFGETEPGVPVGILTAEADIPFITKAGGFGSPETLTRATARLLARTQTG